MKIRAASSKLSAKIAAPWLLIAFSPVILALVTSNPSNPWNVIQDLMRRHGMPIVGVEILVISLAVWSGVRPISSLREAPRWSWFALLLLLGIAAAAALIALDPGLALLYLLLWLLHLLFGLSVAGLAETAPEEIRDNFWAAVVVGLIVFALMLALYVSLIPDPENFFWLGFGFGVTNIRHVGFFATVGIAASLGLALTRRRFGQALLASGAASIFFALASWSGSRGALVASWAALLCALIWFKPLRTVRTIAIIIACSGVGIFLSRLHRVPDRHFGLERISQAMGRDPAEITSGRFKIWRATWDFVLDRPLIGHGQGQFGSLVPEARPLYIKHPHNSILQVAFDWGLLGASCFAALLIYLCWYCLKAIGDDPRSNLPAFLVCAGLIITSLYDGAFFFTYPIVMLVVALAWIAGTEQANGAHEVEGTRRREPSFT